ncbi:MAG: methyltransferase domain-containing protein [Methanomassiliicoccus sp.]|nr:methyltransferase domain-containing protein [Methanomassiliicoccus sp.]
MDSECRLCGHDTTKVFTALMMGRHPIEYRLCGTCGLLQTERPFWLNESYSATVNPSDTHLVVRPIVHSRVVSSIILAFFDRGARFVDYGGGLGLFTRLMRDRGFDYYWMDPYGENLMAQGFEYDGNGRVEAVSSFETFEHFAEPRAEIDRILKISDSLLFSTELLPDAIPGPEEWWYYGLEHGQHVAFYSRRTMEYIAREHGLNYYQCGPVQLLVSRRLDQGKLKLIGRLPSPVADTWNRLSMPTRTVSDMEAIVRKAKLEQMRERK